jgi:hypothetical protein
MQYSAGVLKLLTNIRLGDSDILYSLVTLKRFRTLNPGISAIKLFCHHRCFGKTSWRVGPFEELLAKFNLDLYYKMTVQYKPFH